MVCEGRQYGVRLTPAALTTLRDETLCEKIGCDVEECAQPPPPPFLPRFLRKSIVLRRGRTSDGWPGLCVCRYRLFVEENADTFRARTPPLMEERRHLYATQEGQAETRAYAAQ